MSDPVDRLQRVAHAAGWDIVPFWAIAKRIERKGRSDAELLSVYREWGVVRKADRTDNFNVESEDLSTYKYVEAGDLVLNKMKTWQGSLGVSPHSGIVSPAYFVCQLNPSVHGRYLHYLLRSPAYIALYGASSKGIRPNQWDLPYDSLRMLPVLLPPLDLQERIADFLDDQTARIDNIITARQRQVESLRELGSSGIASVLLGGGSLNGPSENNWYSEIPDSWHLRPLRSGWNVIDCKHRTPEYRDGGYPVVSPGDITPGRLELSRCGRFVDRMDFLDLADELRRCRRGDIVYSRNASAGTAAYVDTDDDFTMGQDVCRITSPRKNEKYLFYVLNHLVQPQLDEARVGSTFTRINVDRIKGLVVPVPPDETQTELADRADALQSQIEDGIQLQTIQIDRLRELKRSLISAAVSGEFDVLSADGSGVVV